MNLADVTKTLRTTSYAEGETRKQWQDRIVETGMGLLRRHHLLDAAARKWLDVEVIGWTARQIKNADGMPRAAAGQMKAWPDMEPVEGRNALRAYVRKYKDVVSRYEFCARMLGILSAAVDSDADLAKFHDLRAALVAAGASTEDIARLSEMDGGSAVAIAS